MSDVNDKLNEALEQENPESFIFSDTNDRIIGTFERVDFGNTDYGRVPIAVLKDEAGKEWGLWMFHAVLRNQFAQVKPKVGEHVGVRFLGKRKGASGREYSNYKVARVPDASAAEFDWTAIADETTETDLAAPSDSPGSPVGGAGASWDQRSPSEIMAERIAQEGTDNSVPDQADASAPVTDARF